VFVAGAVVQWLRDQLGLADSAAAVSALAEQAPDDGGVLFVPALAGLGAPYWDPDARGAVLGITRGTSAAQIARAALHGIAFQVAELVEAMEHGGVRPLELRADGGAAASDVLLQAQADLLDVPVLRAAQTEATALGAAQLAGLALGLMSEDDIARLWRPSRTFAANPGVDRRRLLANWRRGIAAVRQFGAGQP